MLEIGRRAAAVGSLSEGAWMTSSPANFYGATAQTIPVLLLVLAVETTFLANMTRSELVRRRLESWADRGRIPVPAMIASLPILASWWDSLVRATIRTSARPIGKLANFTIVLGTLFLALTAELLAFVGLATEPKPAFIWWSVWITLFAVALLLLETFWALARVVVVGGYGRKQPPKPRGAGQNLADEATSDGSTAG